MLLLFVPVLLLSAPAHAAEPPLLRSFCLTGSAAGECENPRGVEADPTSGRLYVADMGNRRMEKFTAWGEFESAWGRDVVASGPGDNGTGFEVCVPSDGDVCKAGVVGSGAGEFGGNAGGGFTPAGPVGVAVDAAGDVYVVDLTNLRVQKFSPEGQFLLTFGGEVNRTKSEEVGSSEEERNLCPIDPGDVCQEGTQGSGKGQFGLLKVGDAIDTAADGQTIFVGEEGRIQEFNANGHQSGEIPLPGGEMAQSLAVDGNGNFYFTRSSPNASNGSNTKPNVTKLSPAGAVICTIEAHKPMALATGPKGEVYLVDGGISGTPQIPREITQYNSSCGGKTGLFGPEIPAEENNEFSADPTGIAVSLGCRSESEEAEGKVDLVISNPHPLDSFVKLFGPAPTDFEAPCAPPLSLPPDIADTHAVSVGATSATVRARINPHFWNDTGYSVQYATAACIEAEGWGAGCVSQAPADPQLLSEDVFDEFRRTKTVFLGAGGALSPDMEYHYRFRAQSTGGGPTFGAEASFHTYPLSPAPKADCPNQAFRSGPSAYLPDCRAYELVSPVDKNGGDVLAPGLGGLSQAADDGASLTFGSTSAFADPLGAALSNQYLSQRQAGGWSTRSINAPRGPISLVGEENLATRFKAFSENLCSGWLLQDTNLDLVTGAPQNVMNLYRDRALHEGCSGPSGYELLTTVFPPGYDPTVENLDSKYLPQIQGFSADGEIALFRAGAALSADACKIPTESGPEGKRIFQVYLTREGTPGVPPTLVSVLPSGEAACTHSSVGTSLSFGALFNTREDSLHNAVSENGGRIYWTATGGASVDSLAQAGNVPGKLYLRVNPVQKQSKISKSKCTEPLRACTLAVSKEAEAISETTTSLFLDAAADGSRALFRTGDDFYEYDLAKALAGEPATTLIAGDVLGILGASEDASHVYLVSEKELEGKGQAGEPNLYLYQRGFGFDFIATLGGGDALAGDGPNALPSAVGLYPSKHSSRVSPDGLAAAFLSADPALAQSVAGYDNTDLNSGKPDREVYLYDATANEGQGELICASCNQSGARPAGRVTDFGLDTAARLPTWITGMHPGNALSADGNRLFFESFEPLVLRDTNGVGDVYQWERASDKARCLQEQGGELYVPSSGGCLSLISSGTGSADSLLIDASPSGDDVFIRTETSLLPQDPGLADAYDARVVGGFAQSTVTSQCEGEACQSPPAPPNDPTPASAAFEGSGNVAEPAKKPHCRRPKVRRKGRCVVKHKRHAKHRRRDSR